MSSAVPERSASTASLRGRLLAWILGPLTALIALNAWVGYGHAVQAANEAYDRSLYLAARTLAEELVWVDGQAQLELMKAAGYLFENHTGSRLFYKLSTVQGQWLAGARDLPHLPERQEASVQFFALVRFGDAQYLGQSVRLVQLTHVMPDASLSDPLIHITVAETRETRQQMIQRILGDTLRSQGLLLLAAALLVVWAVGRGIRPLEAFRQQWAQKRDDDFSPVHTPHMPRELLPLMDTLNAYVDRLGRLIEIRKRFLDNAAHQLRTPLTVLKTQLSLAQRNAEPDQAGALLQAAINHRRGRALDRTDAGLGPCGACARNTPCAVAGSGAIGTPSHRVACHACPSAGMRFGFDALVPSSQVSGVALLLQEAVANLIDNALHHGPAGTCITTRVGPGWVEVEDDGPGIAPEHQAHVWERFYRAAPSGVVGSGLGLAIVREIALQHGAQWRLQSPVKEGRG